MTTARYQSRNQFLNEQFGDQIRQCPHCAEWNLKTTKCTTCDIDPDAPVLGHLLVSFDGAQWVIYRVDTERNMVGRELFDYKLDATARAREIACKRYPRPTVEVKSYDEPLPHWSKRRKRD